jgi:hypothetical protein
MSPLSLRKCLPRTNTLAYLLKKKQINKKVWLLIENSQLLLKKIKNDKHSSLFNNQRSKEMKKAWHLNEMRPLLPRFLKKYSEFLFSLGIWFSISSTSFRVSLKKLECFAYISCFWLIRETSNLSTSYAVFALVKFSPQTRLGHQLTMVIITSLWECACLGHLGQYDTREILLKGKAQYRWPPCTD